MGSITSRLNLDSLNTGRRRSQQGEETLYSYSLNKSYFSNYFFMGGERFEINDPDYLFGDSCDLNFLTCTKPYSLPYKKAQQILLTNLNTKQKAINKVSSRVNGFGSPLNILTGRHRQVSQSRKQDAQTQTLNNNSKNMSLGPEPSRPLVMLINIRKETLRLVKSPNVYNLDSDQNSPTNTAFKSACETKHKQRAPIMHKHHLHGQGIRETTSRYSTTSADQQNCSHGVETIELEQTMYGSRNYDESDVSSTTSNTLSTSQSTNTTSSTSKSGYTSVRDVPPSESASDENDEFYEDALNEPSHPSHKEDDDDDSDRNQERSLLRASESRRNHCDIKITIGEDSDDGGEDGDYTAEGNSGDIENDPTNLGRDKPDGAKLSTTTNTSGYKTQSRILTKVVGKNRKNISGDKKLSGEPGQNSSAASNRVYNIEFYFDAEVDCSIRVSYFCTREVSSNNVTYKPQHATYKSKSYIYKRGLNQKFEQQEHTFQPYLFDEDLLIYKPLDTDGNYNSGAVFPIVIHCVALEGPTPRQSQSLVATVEKSQLDDSYSIKPLKQLIFVDGVQYILQDIYGIENKPLSSTKTRPPRNSSSHTPNLNRKFRSSCNSLYSVTNEASNMNLSDTASIGSAMNASLEDAPNRSSLVSNQFRSLGSENTFECVICMSDERDTMLLPCRHMCLCSSCAHSLRYQSNACPICRCAFKAALHLRFYKRSALHRQSLAASSVEEQENETTTAMTVDTNVDGTNNVRENESISNKSARQGSLTNSATPLLARQKGTDTDMEEGNAGHTAAAAVVKKQRLPARPTDAVQVATSVLPIVASSSATRRVSRSAAASVEVHNAVLGGSGAGANVSACESATLKTHSNLDRVQASTAPMTQEVKGATNKCSQTPKEYS